MGDNSSYVYAALVDAMRQEIRACEAASGAACPAACYVERPPEGMEASKEVLRRVAHDFRVAEDVMGKCTGDPSRVCRMKAVADVLVNTLNGALENDG